MAKKYFSTEEAFQIICASDESCGELSESLSDSDSAYEPVTSSGSDTESEEECVPTKRRRSGVEQQQQQPTTSSTVPSTPRAVPSTPRAVPSTSRAVPSTSRAVQQRPGTSRMSSPPQRDRSHASLPYGLQNPLWLPSDSGATHIPPFTAQPGVQVNTENFSMIDFFYLLFPEELFSSIVAQCNLYAQQFIESNPDSSYARPFEWRDLTVEEFKVFLGLTFNMGLSKKKQSYSYWSTKAIHHMPVFSSRMPRSRYFMILRFLHYNDNTQCPPRNDPSFDKLFKIRPLLNFFSERFPQLYTPEQHISIDESLVKFHGRLGIKQFIPSKRARYGVKMYKLCERDTGYIYSYTVYEGKDSQLHPPECPEYIGTSGKVVWELIYPLLGKGYHLYVDNFYTSLPLFRNLYRRDTPACGTVRTNRKGFPQKLVNQKLRKGEKTSLRNQELLAVKWRDRRDVHMLTTIHDDTYVEVPKRRGPPVQKPSCVYDYNLFMGGVDFNDQMIEPYLPSRKSRHWYKKVSIYLFSLAFYNAYVIYKKSTPNPAPYLYFQEEVVTALLFSEIPLEILRIDCVSRLHECHFPDKLPPLENGRKRQKRCRVCSRRGFRRDTTVYCPDCPSQPGLCLGACFRRYHTTENY